MKFRFEELLLVFLVIWSCSPKTQMPSASKQPGSAPAQIVPQTITETIPGTDVSFQMALIPGGGFTMGSPDNEVGRNEDEGPQIEVQLDSIWVGVHEVSYEEYQVFRDKDLDKVPPGKEGSWNADAITRPSPPYEDPTFGMGNRGYPAVSMTQLAALQYCKWLSDKTGRFYRLPTEAEWEIACRAGTTTAFYFGDSPADEYVWHAGNSDGRYHQIGTRKPNPWGLFDMHGNISEWTLDQYDKDYYQQLADQAEARSNPWARPTKLHPRTVKGGSWDDALDVHRCASRIKSDFKWKERDPQIPKSFWWNTDSPFVGFRLVSPFRQPTQEERSAFWNLVLGG